MINYKEILTKANKHFKIECSLEIFLDGSGSIRIMGHLQEEEPFFEFNTESELTTFIEQL